jgi:hypothetical protein
MVVLLVQAVVDIMVVFKDKVMEMAVLEVQVDQAAAAVVVDMDKHLIHLL